MNVIDKARERIERDGWWKHGSTSSGSCVVTAVGRAARASGENLAPALNLIASEADLPDFGAIPRWNDDPSTSLEDVLLVMKRASARLDEEAAR